MSQIDPSALKSYGIDDDSPEIRRIRNELWRNMPPWRKLELASQMWNTCRMFAMAGLRSQFPEADEAEIRRRLPCRILPRELVIKVYGWDPAAEEE